MQSRAGRAAPLQAAAALPAMSPFPGLDAAVPASELRNQPAVTPNDLSEPPVRLNG